MVVVTGGMVVETVVMVVETDVMEETGAIVGATRVVVVVEDTIETGKYAIPFLSEAFRCTNHLSFYFQYSSA